jgi:integrase
MSTPETPTGLSYLFGPQAQRWLHSLASQRRNPLSPTSISAFTSYVNRLVPMIGADKPLADINSGTLRDLVTQLIAEALSPKSIGELVATVKQVVASAVDGNGDPIFPRQWNSKHIDAPSIGKQKQPSITRQDVERCIKDAASDQEQVLYCALAGSGLRIAEALAIHVSGTEDQTSWNPESQTIVVRSSIFNGREIPRLKTVAARRTVDIDLRLNDLIATFVEISGIEPGDYLFQARSGRPMHLKTARRRLAARGIPGFHSFRRFFVSRRRSLGFPEFLLRSIVGHSGKSITEEHSGKSVTDLYDKSAEDEAYRKEWASKAGLGFELPELGTSGRPESRIDSPRRTVKPGMTHGPAEPVSLAEEVVVPSPYQASDEDLPAELFERPTEQLIEVK